MSNKILFETKEEIIEFFGMLLKYGLKDSALNYMEELLQYIDDVELINGFNSLFRK